MFPPEPFFRYLMLVEKERGKKDWRRTHTFKSLESMIHFCIELHYNQLHEIIYWNALRTVPAQEIKTIMGWLWELP